MAPSAVVRFSIVMFAVLCLLPVAAAGAEHTTPVNSVRVLGPVSRPDEGPKPEGAWSPVVESVPEIDPSVDGPWSSTPIELTPGVGLTWIEAAESGDGGLTLGDEGVYWIAATAVADRFAEIGVRVSGADVSGVWLNGSELATPAASEEPRSGAVVRGANRMLVRAIAGQGASIRMSVETDTAVELRWTSETTVAPTRYDMARRIVAIGDLAINSTGTMIARRLTERDARGHGTRSTVSILDASGKVLVPAIGDGSSRPVAFSPDDSALLLKRSAGAGSELVVYDIAAGDVHTVVVDEPELGAVRWHPSGSHLLVVSARGVSEETPDEKAPIRRRALREKVTDYATGPHLHLIHVQTGARRRLTVPGDWVIDDAAFTPDGGGVVYARTVPQAPYPWFVTEFRHMDLESSRDRLIGVMPCGWESRPRRLAISPTGTDLAFLGPPEQVVEERAGLNILQAAVWRVGLDGGEFQKVSGDAPLAFTLRGSDSLGWTADGSGLVAAVTDRTGAGLATLTRSGDGSWNVQRVPDPDGEVAERLAVSSDRSSAVLVTSNPERPRRLVFVDLSDGSHRILEEPNARIEREWLLAQVEDASFIGPSGDRIDAWWYRPHEPQDTEKVPLIVYYYGGGTPRMRSFSFDFQFFAANGYAVLVVTPRGALGADQAFADSHVNDWGPRASADILAGVDRFLEAHPEIDSEGIGIYGGSYGGFMTAYLLTVTDRFAAAVDLFGIANLASYWGDGAWGYTYGDVAGFGSFPWNAPEIYAGHSPLFRADKITTPLLLLHGMADTNVPTHESEQLYAALRVLDRPAELVLFPDEDHGISGTWTNRSEHRTMMLEWFDLHIKDQPEAWRHRWNRK